MNMGEDVLKIVATLLKIVYLRNVKALLASVWLLIKLYVELCSMRWFRYIYSVDYLMIMHQLNNVGCLFWSKVCFTDELYSIIHFDIFYKMV